MLNLSQNRRSAGRKMNGGPTDCEARMMACDHDCLCPVAPLKVNLPLRLITISRRRVREVDVGLWASSPRHCMLINVRFFLYREARDQHYVWTSVAIGPCAPVHHFDRFRFRLELHW